jgi:hypothetical protein
MHQPSLLSLEARPLLPQDWSSLRREDSYFQGECDTSGERKLRTLTDIYTRGISKPKFEKVMLYSLLQLIKRGSAYTGSNRLIPAHCHEEVAEDERIQLVERERPPPRPRPRMHNRPPESQDIREVKAEQSGDMNGRSTIEVQETYPQKPFYEKYIVRN